MTEPIDIIDLTVDSPHKIQRNLSVSILNKKRNRNIENIPRNGTTTTKSQKHHTRKQQSVQLNESVIEIPSKSIAKSVQSTEVIDVDAISSASNTVPSLNDSREKDAATLTCPICFERLSSKLKPMTTRCGHIFCSHCLELAVRASKKCPTCKRAVRFQNCTRLYF